MSHTDPWGFLGKDLHHFAIVHKVTGPERAAGCGLSSAPAIVSPIYVLLTNPLSRLEVIMQTADISGKHIAEGLADF